MPRGGRRPQERCEGHDVAPSEWQGPPKHRCGYSLPPHSRVDLPGRRGRRGRGGAAGRCRRGQGAAATCRRGRGAAAAAAAVAAPLSFVGPRQDIRGLLAAVLPGSPRALLCSTEPELGHGRVRRPIGVHVQRSGVLLRLGSRLDRQPLRWRGAARVGGFARLGGSAPPRAGPRPRQHARAARARGPGPGGAAGAGGEVALAALGARQRSEGFSRACRPLCLGYAFERLHRWCARKVPR
mmetsp:Transcript_101597/g.326511  ORF Transcript_101597/g.326511 Transcript_101597/m.326511 type:complete len:239 (-) Transcript_101597:1062-1778(-)